MDLYGETYAGYDSSVNFITCHDGFTLHDLYAYNSKHNEDNGWNNTDGADDNRSWNCGAEGETSDPQILSLRWRMMRNAITVLMCSRGTPMILAGDEFGNTQFGNNNAYCQDNEISWLNWDLIKEHREYFDFYRNMIQFRRRHPAIRKDLEPAHCGLPFISVCTDSPWHREINNITKVLSVMFAGYSTPRASDDIVYLTINVYWEEQLIELPEPPAGGYWSLTVDTADASGRWYHSRPVPVTARSWQLNPRSVAVFIVSWGAEYGR